MPHPIGRHVADKIIVQLIEADVETGFALVDEAQAYHASGHPEFSLRARQAAEDVISGIERRLQRLADSESSPFHLLVTELRNEIAALGRGTA